MCLSSLMPKPPKMPAPIPLPPPISAESVDQTALDQKNRDRKRLMGAKGRQSTILASANGGGSTNTGSYKTALGM